MYVINLGINDLRYKSPKTVLTYIWSLVNRLLDASNAKIFVSCLTPCLNNKKLFDKITELNGLISYLTSEYRVFRKLQGRLFTIFNNNFYYGSYETSKRELELFYEDGLHLNRIGLKKLCSSIKVSILRSLGIRSYLSHAAL